MKPAIVFFGRIWRNLNRRVSRAYVDVSTKKTTHKMEKIGSYANGWFVPLDMPKNALCYCVGVGRDASFDFELVDRGANVFSFDPTPPAVEYMRQKNTQGKVNFRPWGLLDEDSSMRLFFPLAGDHGSYFIEDLHRTGQYYEVPCYRLKTIMEKLSHDSLYILKIDIEGSWYRALKDVIMSEIFAEFLQVEFDSPAPVWRVAHIVRLLAQSGYKLVLREGDNAVFKYTGRPSGEHDLTGPG